MDKLRAYMGRVIRVFDREIIFFESKYIKEGFTQIDAFGRRKNNKKLLVVHSYNEELVNTLYKIKEYAEETGKVEAFFVKKSINKPDIDIVFGEYEKTLLPLEKQVHRAVELLSSINSQIDMFRDVRLSFKEKENKGLRVAKTLNMLKKYIKIDSEYGKKKDRTMGYYEIAISDDVIAGKVAPIIRSGITSSIFLLILSIAAGVFLSLYLVKPITMLTNGVKRVSKDLNQRIEMNRKDEYGYLASEFNNMISQIQEYSKGLEQKVEERTADLKKSLDRVNALKT